jgi:hypothetical protein
MTEKKTETEELLEKLSKTEELLGKISKYLEDPNKGVETSKERELQIDIAKLQADSAHMSERKVIETEPSETKPSETKPSETKPKKMHSRSVAVALGIICILLIAGLGGAVAYYTVKLNDKENQINSANNTINQLNANMTDQNSTIVSLNAIITNLTNEENQLQTWLDENKTLLNQTQAWLNGNETLLLAENITSYEAQISSLNAQIIQLRTWLSGNITAYQNEITLYDNQVNQYNNYVADHHHTDEDYNAISSQNTNLINITNLAKSIVWENNDSIQQPAGQYTNWTESVTYAGYVSVWVQSSNATGTPSAHVAVTYSAYGVSFNQEIGVSVGGTAVFPVLPSNVTIFVGNGNLGFQGGASETVTITYFY